MVYTEFELNRELGRHLPRRDFEAELAAWAVILETSIKHLFNTRVGEWIALVGGHPNKSPDFLQVLHNSLEEELSSYASTQTFQVIFTEEAYLWLQRNMGFSRTCRVWGIKGSSNPLPGKLKMGSVLNKTPSGKALRMGMLLVLLDTDKIKEMFYERMGKALAGEGGGA